MDDLIAFLRAQLDVDEQTARAVQDNSAPWAGEWKPDGDHAVRTCNDWVLAYGHDGRPLPPGFTGHVARHDPARVLRDVKAKRALIELHPCAGEDVGEPFCFTCTSDQDLYREDLAGRWPCPTLRLLAAGYDTEPGWREEWRG